MSATPLLTDVEDAAWEFAPPAIAEREPWEVNMELPGGGLPIWKSFDSTPELFDLKLLIRDAICDADTSTWDIFVDGDRLTNENTINMLKGKSATRTDGQAQRVKYVKCILRWPMWIVLSMSFLMFCSLAFAIWCDRAYAHSPEDDRVKTSATKYQALEEGKEEGRSKQASSDMTQLDASKHKASEEGLQEGRRQVAGEAEMLHETKKEAYDKGVKEGEKRPASSEEGLKEGASRQASSRADTINTTLEDEQEAEDDVACQLYNNLQYVFFGGSVWTLLLLVPVYRTVEKAMKAKYDCAAQLLVLLALGLTFVLAFFFIAKCAVWIAHLVVKDLQGQIHHQCGVRMVAR